MTNILLDLHSSKVTLEAGTSVKIRLRMMSVHTYTPLAKSALSHQDRNHLSLSEPSLLQLPVLAFEIPDLPVSKTICWASVSFEIITG